MDDPDLSFELSSHRRGVPRTPPAGNGGQTEGDEESGAGTEDSPVGFPLTRPSGTGKHVDVAIILPSLGRAIDLGEERDLVPACPASDLFRLWMAASLQVQVRIRRRRRRGKRGKGWVTAEDAGQVGSGVFRGRGDRSVRDGEEGGGREERRR